MATVSETIPESLQPEVEAALAWFNSTQRDDFEVTGIIDPEESLAARTPRELRLVLCGGDTCQQRTFRVASAERGFDIAIAQGEPETDPNARVQAELDPPPGARRSWLDTVLGRHAFVVLVFYRGFW